MLAVPGASGAPGAESAAWLWTPIRASVRNLICESQLRGHCARNLQLDRASTPRRPAGTWNPSRSNICSRASPGTWPRSSTAGSIPPGRALPV